MKVKKSTSKAPKKPASKAPAKKSKPAKSEAKKSKPEAKPTSKDDGVRLSNEVNGGRTERTGDSPETGETNSTEEAREPGQTEDGKPKDETAGTESSELESLKEEVDELKTLMEGLSENFGSPEAAQESAAQPSGGSPSGGGESGGGDDSAKEAQGAQGPQQSNPMQNAQAMNAMNGGIDNQLTQMATQILAATMGGGMMPGTMGPMGGNGNFGQNPMGPQGFGGMQNGIQGGQFGGQNQVGALRGQLMNLYTQAGGPNNRGIRPQTHQLVQLALGGQGAGMGMMPGMGVGTGQMGFNPMATPGMPGASNFFGARPNFGGF